MFIRDDRIYWFRDEDIRLESCVGLHATTANFEQSYDIIDPHETWHITAEGTCQVADSSWGIYTGTDEEVDLTADLTFQEPLHNASSIDLLVDSQHHYDQAGRYTGTIAINSDEFEVDATGFQDHSWEWFRDWTPGKWDHYWTGFRFETGECFTIVSRIRPDGRVGNTYGYHTDGDKIHSIIDSRVECHDGLDRMERAEEWARGNFPDKIVFSLEFDDRQTEIECTPTHNTPLGFEDRNWELSDIDVPWLTSFLNRMAVDCTWGSNSGSGWIEGLW